MIAKGCWSNPALQSLLRRSEAIDGSTELTMSGVVYIRLRF